MIWSKLWNLKEEQVLRLGTQMFLVERQRLFLKDNGGEFISRFQKEIQSMGLRKNSVGEGDFEDALLYSTADLTFKNLETANFNEAYVKDKALLLVQYNDHCFYITSETKI